MDERGFAMNQRSGGGHVSLSVREAPLMRLSVDSLRQVVKRDLPIEFVPQQLTSYGGLELLHRYVRRLGLYPRLRRACADLGGDYGRGPAAVRPPPRFFHRGRGGGSAKKIARGPPPPPPPGALARAPP